MLTLDKIQFLWESKINNYLKNYAQRNQLLIVQVRANLLIEAHENFIEGSLVESKMFLDSVTHEKNENQFDSYFLLKPSNNGRANLHEWLTLIFEDYCEEQALEDQVFVEHIKITFYDDLHDMLFYIIRTLLHKSLLGKCIVYILEYYPLL